MISRSISALRLRFPTRLKLDSILQSSFNRRHLEQSLQGSWLTSHRSYDLGSPVSKMCSCKLIVRQVASPPSRCRIITIDAPHLLLSAFIASPLYWLSPLVISVIILRIINTPRRAVHPRNGDIPFATLQAIGRGHRERRMIDTRHYGTYDRWSIISSNT